MGTLKRGEYAPRNEQDELDIETQARALQHYALERGYVVELLIKSNPAKPVTGAHTLGVAMRRVRAGSPLTAFVGLSNKPLSDLYAGEPAEDIPVAAFTDVFKEESA
jgi:hypothetical protein